MKILAISDQHGHFFDIPPCDVLIVAGDLCPDVIGGQSARNDPERQLRWFRTMWLSWRYQQPARHCIVTWGNHDYGGELLRNAVDGYGAEGKQTIIACDNLVQIPGLSVYLTPWSNAFMRWAFMKEPTKLARYYENIPEGVDVLVSHQPPMGYGSQCRYCDPRDGQWKTEHVGSVELLAAIQRTKPRAVVCGHVHSGYGTYDCDGIPVYNVSVVDEGYSLVHEPTTVELAKSDPARFTPSAERQAIGSA